MAPIEGVDEELDEWIDGADDKKRQLHDADENFDEMMVDEGVSATNMRWFRLETYWGPVHLCIINIYELNQFW